MSRLRKHNIMAETQRNTSNSPYKLDLQEKTNVKKKEKKHFISESHKQSGERNNKKEWKQLQNQV